MKKIIMAVTAVIMSFLMLDVWGGKVLIISLSAHRWYAYNDGKLMGSGRVSGGRGYCPDIHRGCHTPTGNFRIISKGPASCRSTIYPKPYGGAPMQYCMFFTRLYAIHGSNDVPGYHASHGCVRVLPAAAAWLSHNFVDIGTPVIIKW